MPSLQLFRGWLLGGVLLSAACAHPATTPLLPASPPPASSPDLASRLRRAWQLLDLRDLDAAREAFRQLQQEFPRDARPVVGLVSCEIRDGAPLAGKVSDLRRVLQQAASLEHRDGSYHGLLVGLLGLEAGPLLPASSSSATDRVLASLEQIEFASDEHASFAPDRAAILSFLLHSARDEVTTSHPQKETFDQRMRKRCHESRALCARFPGSHDGYRLSLGCSLFDEPELAFPFVLAPVPEGLRDDTALLTQRARLAVGLVTVHHAHERIGDARALVEALPADHDAQRLRRTLLLADLAALRAQHARSSWSEAIELYSRARPLVPDDELPRVLNNLAVARAAERLPSSETVALLEEAASRARHGRDRLARVSLASLALARGATAEAMTLLEPFVQDPHAPLAARLQLVRVARKLHRTTLAHHQARLALDALREEEQNKFDGFEGIPFLDRKGTFLVRLGLSSREPTYSLEISFLYEPVFVLSSGLTYPQLIQTAAILRESPLP